MQGELITYILGIWRPDGDQILVNPGVIGVGYTDEQEQDPDLEYA